MTTCEIMWLITVGAQNPDDEQSGSELVSYSPNRTDVLCVRVRKNSQQYSIAAHLIGDFRVLKLIQFPLSFKLRLLLTSGDLLPLPMHNEQLSELLFAK